MMAMGSHDMLPRASRADGVDGLACDPVRPGDVGASFAMVESLADCSHVVIGEGRLGVLVPDERLCLATFGDHVSHVVELSSEEQVIRVDAPGVVAPVQDVTSSDWLLTLQQPRDPVCRQNDTAKAEAAIPVLVRRSDPLDAVVFARSAVALKPGSLGALNTDGLIGFDVNHTRLLPHE